jgi:hypothetical protein
MKYLKVSSLLLIAALSLITASTLFLAVPLTTAQEKAAQSSQEAAPAKKRKQVVFFLFKNYFSDKFPNHKAGVLILNPKKPSGMFLVYPDEGESTQELTNKIKSMVAGMFFHGLSSKDKADVTWNMSPLSKHEGVENELGTMFLASDEKEEAQLAIYIRNFDGTEIAYGYFAGRAKGGKAEEAGQFLDSRGGGAEDFDKFWKSIREAK